MRLLIVEDEKRLREVLVKHLKKNNYSVDACATGEEAKEFLAMADYDVAILDVMLPGISGFDVLKWARGQKMEVPVNSSRKSFILPNLPLERIFLPGMDLLTA